MGQEFFNDGIALMYRDLTEFLAGYPPEKSENPLKR